MANVVVSALATWNGKALKKAQQDVNVFEKRIKSFARTFGFAFSAAAVVAFSKKAVKAFAQDEAAAKSLQLQLENTGNAFRVTEVEAYIKELEKTYAILTDLRKPFQTFLNLTRSVALSQRTLEAALNISAGTGQSLETVVGALAAGIRGQMRSLSALNTGIDANIIKSGDMNKIMAELEKKFSGQAAARLDTYAGKMDVLKKGADEATKAIGEGLVDALVILSKDKSVETLANSFENLAENIAYAIRELAKLIKGFSDLVSNPSFKAGLLALAIASKSPKAVAAAFTIVGGSAIAGVASSDFGRRELPDNQKRSASRMELKAIKDNVRYRQLEVKILKEKTAVDELAAKFDVERIGFAKALNEATDEETKLRIKSQIAILDNNEALAKKILAELAAAEAAKKLALTYEQALESVKLMNARIAAFLAGFGMGTGTSGGGGGGGGGGLGNITYSAALSMARATNTKIQDFLDQFNSGSNITGTDIVDFSVPATNGIFDPSGFRQSESRDLTITVDTSATGDRFAALIAESLQIAQKSGVSYGIAGGL